MLGVQTFLMVFLMVDCRVNTGFSFSIWIIRTLFSFLLFDCLNQINHNICMRGHTKDLWWYLNHLHLALAYIQYRDNWVLGREFVYIFFRLEFTSLFFFLYIRKLQRTDHSGQFWFLWYFKFKIEVTRKLLCVYILMLLHN